MKNVNGNKGFWGNRSSLGFFFWDCMYKIFGSHEFAWFALYKTEIWLDQCNCTTCIHGALCPAITFLALQLLRRSVWRSWLTVIYGWQFRKMKVWASLKGESSPKGALPLYTRIDLALHDRNFCAIFVFFSSNIHASVLLFGLLWSVVFCVWFFFFDPLFCVCLVKTFCSIF